MLPLSFIPHCTLISLCVDMRALIIHWTPLVEWAGITSWGVLHGTSFDHVTLSFNLGVSLQSCADLLDAVWVVKLGWAWSCNFKCFLERFDNDLILLIEGACLEVLLLPCDAVAHEVGGPGHHVQRSGQVTSVIDWFSKGSTAFVLIMVLFTGFIVDFIDSDFASFDQILEIVKWGSLRILIYLLLALVRWIRPWICVLAKCRELTA